MAVSIGNSRVGNASRVAVGTEDTNYTLPSNSVEYVYAASVSISGGDRIDSGDSVTLQFRTGADAFATLSNASGAVRTGTVLTDQNAVTSGERLTTTGGTYVEGVEIEGTNSVGTQLNRTQSGACECQWSLDFSNAPSGTTYDFQVVWAHKNGTNTFQYLSITTHTPVPPVLSAATVTDRANTTATVGCTTDTPAEGTLFYYVSTSATPPTANNLKNGIDAAAFGNTTNPTAPQTFSATGLTKGTTYYTHFIHNNTLGDSNILTSNSWTTTNFTQKVWRARAIDEALTGTTWLAAENTAVGVDVTSGDATLRVRLGRENTITPDLATLSQSMTWPQYRVNSGAWFSIDSLTPGSDACSLTETTAYDASATGYVADDTKRLTGHTGNILSGCGWASEWTDLSYSHPSTSINLAGVEEFEYAIVFNAVNLTDSDVVEIRINSTLVTDYTAYATFNITKGSAPVTGSTTLSLNTSENIINNLSTNESSSFSSNLTEAVANTLSTLSTATLDLDAGKIYQNSISSIQFSDLSVTLDKLIDEIVIFNSSALLGVNSSLQSSNNLNTNGSSSLSQNLEQTIFNILTGRTNAYLNLNLGENLLNTATINSTIQYAIDIASICSSITTKEAAINFVSNFTKAALNVNNALAELLVDLVIASNYESIKTSIASIDFGTTLTKTSEGLTAAVVDGELTLGVFVAKLSDKFATVASSINFSSILSTTEEVSKLLSGATTFTLNLVADKDYLSTAIFDDAIWSLSNNQYVFVDLTNVVIDSGNIKAVSLTISNQLGQTQTVALVGQAASEILLTLGKLQNSSALYSASSNIGTNLTKTSSVFASFFKDLTLAIDFGKLSAADTAKLGNLFLAISLAGNQINSKITSDNTILSVNLDKLSTSNVETFVSALYGIIGGETANNSITRQSTTTLDINLSKVPTNTATLLTNILVTANLGKTSTRNLTTNSQLVLDILMTEETINSLLANATIDIGITKGVLSSTTADLNVAIQYLQNLIFLTDASKYSITPALTSFDLNLIKNNEIRGILNTNLTLISLLGDTESSYALLRDTIEYLIQVQQQVSSNYIGVSALELLLNVSTQQEGNTGILGALDLVLNLTKQYNITVDYYEILSLVLTLVKTSNTAANIPGSINFGATLSQSQLNTLTAVLTAIFAQIFDVTNSVQADLSTVVNLATFIATNLVGEPTGNPEVFITFGTDISTNNISIKQTFDIIEFAAILADSSNVSKLLQIPMEFGITLEDLSNFDLLRSGVVNFSTQLIKAGNNRLLARPSLRVDLQLADFSANAKQTLSSLILQLQQSVTNVGASTLPVFINYGLLNSLNLVIRLIADGRITLTNELQKTGITQLLAQANLTFGHIIGLASLNGALREAGIEIGTITGVSVSGFRIEFELITPDGRKFKVYLEDRITIVDEENRVIQIFGKNRGTTIN